MVVHQKRHRAQVEESVIDKRGLLFFKKVFGRQNSYWSQGARHFIKLLSPFFKELCYYEETKHFIGPLEWVWITQHNITIEK